MEIKITETGIKIIDDVCWICGKKQNLTNHHGIPQYLHPIKNIEIPICADCHSKHHSQDMSIILAYVFKTNKILIEGVKNIAVLQDMVQKKKKESETLTFADLLKEK